MDPSRRLNALFVLAVLLLGRASCSSSSSSSDAPRKLSVLLGAEVTLSCRFGKVAELQWSSLTVEWKLLDRDGRKRTLFMLEDGRVRPGGGGGGGGSLLQGAATLCGEAALCLHNVSVRDEGLYTCRVITPVVHTESTALAVLARPSVSLPEKVVLSDGEEKTIQCDIVGFFPQKVAVSWQLWNGSHAVPASGNRLLRVCTEMAVKRADGTFSIRSGVTLSAAAVEGGWSSVLCQVEHQSFSTAFNTSVTLTVEAPPAALGPHAIIAASCALSVLLVSAAVGGLLLLHRLLCKGFYAVHGLTDGDQKTKAALSVSEIFQPDIIYAEVPAELRCSIGGAPLEELKVCWFRLRGEAEAASAPLLGGGGGGGSEELSAQASLLSEGRQHTSVLSVCVSVSEDRSRFQCVVLWQDRSFTREVTLEVKVEPSFLQISSIPQVPQVEKQLVLCCRVENFYPPNIHLEWFRNDGQPVHGVTHFGPISDHRLLCRVWSKVQLLMAREDERLVYTCRVYHGGFPCPGYKDAVYHINTQGAPPSVMLISCEPFQPLLQQELTLHLCIKDFCPEEIEVTWTRDGDAVQSGVFNAPPSLNINGLYSTFSFLKLRAGEEDRGSTFRCRVVHSAQSRPEERSFTLLPADGCSTGRKQGGEHAGKPSAWTLFGGS